MGLCTCNLEGYYLFILVPVEAESLKQNRSSVLDLLALYGIMNCTKLYTTILKLLRHDLAPAWRSLWRFKLILPQCNVCRVQLHVVSFKRVS